MGLFLNLSPKTRGIILMILQCLGAAILTCIVRHLSASLPTPVIVFGRNFFSLMFLLPWFFLKGRHIVHKPRWRLYLMRGGFGLIAMQLWFHSLSIVELPLATSLSFVSPLISAILAVLIYKEKTSFATWLSLCVGFGGVLLILRPGTDAFHWSALWVLVTAAMWSVSGVIIKSLIRTQSPVAVVFFMGIIMTPLSLPFLFLQWQMPVGVEWFWLIALGLVSVLFQIALSMAIASTDLVHILPYDFSRLLFVSIIAYFFFGEILDGWTLIGSLIIIGATVASTHHESRKARRLAKNAQINKA
jgi:drug/metabolite transporter (DMT)-like permease